MIAGIAQFGFGTIVFRQQPASQLNEPLHAIRRPVEPIHSCNELLDALQKLELGSGKRHPQFAEQLVLARRHAAL